MMQRIITTDRRKMTDEFKEFVISHWGFVAICALALILSYGFAISNFSLSIDEEIHMSSDQIAAWLPQGRFMISLMKFVLGDRAPLPFLNLALSLLALLCSAVLWAFLFVRSAPEKLTHNAALSVFAVYYATIPSNAFYLAFNTYNVEISFGFVMAALSALLSWCWSIERKGLGYAFFSALFALFAAGTYQSFAVVCVAGVLIAQLLRALSAEEEAAAESTRTTINQSLVLAAPILVGFAFSTAISAFLSAGKGYTDIFFNWGKLDTEFIVNWLVRYVIDTVMGRGFVGGGVVLPAVVVSVGLSFVILQRSIRSARWMSLLIFLVILVSPFLLSFALGTPLPNRTQQVLPLVLGSVFLMASIVFDRVFLRTSVVAFFLALLTTWNAQANTRLFLSKYLTYQYDQKQAEQIVGRLTGEGWSGEPVPLVIVGEMALPKRRFLIEAETIGASFFVWDHGSRAPIFMNVMGYRFVGPSIEQQKLGELAAKSMPAWPARGSVVLKSGVAIVKMSDPVG